MVKKFLGIFKRDKSVFSDEELKWQAKIGKRVRGTLIAILGISDAIISYLLLIILCNFFSEISWNIDIVTGLIIVFWIVEIGIVCVITVVIWEITRMVFKEKEINAQLENLKQIEKEKQKEEQKEKQKEKILSCLENRDFLKLGIDWPMIDSFFQLCLMCGMIEIMPSSDGVKVSISNSIQDIFSFSINRDELLDYFDVDDDEEK